ncbi:uncharacterized protein LOC131673387 [Phymastichus coffea]|uniref:uncharacterized protein LOC131673387 n=1 Tax=Phymastichus coffea TaxID=108790 RepID=UPI00273C325F|nr:uncharacterized protein LOC131673387 [Phymastichus coffea]
MPQYMEMNPPTPPGQGEEDCLYPISPQLIPHARPYVQPHPLTPEQLYAIFRPPPPDPLPLLNELLVNQLNFNHYNNTLPAISRMRQRHKVFPAVATLSRNMTTEDALHYLHNQQLPPQLYQIRHSR